MFAVYPPIAASEARLLAANSRGNKKSRAAVETYDCKHCNRSFNKQYNLLIHERSHEKSENQTLFNCNICGKGFRSMNNMKNHRYCFYLSCSLHGFTKSESQISIFFKKWKSNAFVPFWNQRKRNWNMFLTFNFLYYFRQQTDAIWKFPLSIANEIRFSTYI